MADQSRPDDEELGMGRTIDRRDFLNGVAVALGALGMSLGSGLEARAAGDPVWPQDQSGYYPPLLDKMRGNHPGSFEAAHALRDGNFWSGASGIRDTREAYDLIVVGG